MQQSRNTIQSVRDRFPGTVDFVETFDVDEDEPSDVLSFELLREAFATIQTAESELVLSIPEIETSAATEQNHQPNDAVYDVPDYENESGDTLLRVENSAAVGIRLETIIEAMLFVGNRENRPLTAEQIAEKLRDVSVEEVESVVQYLNDHYRQRNRPYTIVTENGGYRMKLRSEFEAVRDNFYGKTREIRLTQQAIDILAVVAYRQPITAEEVQNIRQQSCTTVLNQLVKRKLLKTSRKEHEKDDVHYHTTSRFLELLQIKSLDVLPKLEELLADSYR